MANIFDEAPEGQPESFVSGDYAAWKRSDVAGKFATSTYSAQYVGRQRGGIAEFTISSTKQADHFLFSATSSQTAAFEAGEYDWQLEITRDSDSARLVVDRGRITIVPDLDRAGADVRSHAVVMVTKIESLLTGKADSDVSSYSIAGRSLTKLSFSELVEARDYYRSEVKREQAIEDVKNGRKVGGPTIKVRF